jgi:hypothetical protein
MKCPYKIEFNLHCVNASDECVILIDLIGFPVKGSVFDTPVEVGEHRTVVGK